MVIDEPPADAGHDLFLCYAWEDKTRADALHEALNDAGLTVFQDEPGMEDFDYIPERIDAALRSARALLVLYTPSLPASEYCRQEMHFALLRSYRLHRRRSRVLAVVQGVDIADVRPGRLKHWRLPRPDSDPRAVAVEIARHLANLRRDDPRRLGDAPDPPPVRWLTGVRRDPHELYGRELDLWRIHDALFPEDDPDSGGQVAAVIGPPGQGKTMLAEQYARLFSADVLGRVFMHDGAARLERLGRGPGHLPPELTDGRPYLWIVDNVPDGIDLGQFNALLAPTAAGRTLLTAHHDLRGWVHPERHIRLDSLGRAAALATLTCRWPVTVEEGVQRRLRRLRDDRREYGAARSVIDALGAHPLGLRLAAGLAGAPDFAGFGALAAQVADPGRDVLTAAEQLRPRLSTEHSGSVAATMASSLMALNEAGRDVMMLASVLAPAPIPDDVVAEVLTAADGLQPAEAAGRASAGLAGCVDRCLVEAVSADRDGPPQWLAHPLVLNAVRAVYRDDPRRQSLRLAAVSVLSGRVDAAREQHRTGDDLLAVVPHVIAVAAAMRDLDEWHLLNEAARVRVELGDSQGALEIYGRLHEHCRTVLGADDPVTLAAQVGLGGAYGLHGAHSTASRLLNQVLAVLRERHGPQHPDTLTVLNDIAVVHACAGEYEAARDRYQVVHEARERTLGPWHPDTLDALYNLATAVGRCGDTDAALQLKQRVYDAHKSALGETHERTLESLSSLAATMLTLQRHDTTRRMYRQVYEHRHRLPGAVAADAAENLAAAEDDAELVARLRSEAYRIRLAVQGPGHPRTLRSLRLLLGELLRADAAAPAGPAPANATEPAQALPAGVRPEDIRLDDDHMDARVELFDAAGAYYDRQLAQFGPDAVQTASAVVMLAHALAALDQFDLQFDQAWTLVDDAVDGLETDLGVDHPASRAADAVRRWIAVIEPDRRSQGVQREPA